MSKISNSNTKELDIVELIRICIDNKKIILSFIIILSLFLFFLLLNIINKIESQRINSLSINILFNDEAVIFGNISEAEDKAEIKAIYDTIIPFNKRLLSPLNYESWMYENPELAIHFSQVETHQISISKFNQILLEYISEKEYEAIVSYVDYTITKHQSLLHQNSIKQLEENILILNNEYKKRKNDDAVFNKKLQVLQDISINDKVDKEIYYKELVKTYADIDSNLYLLKTLNMRLENLQNNLLQIKEGGSGKNNAFTIRMGNVTTTPIYLNNGILIDKYPYVIFLFIPIVDIILFVFLILYFRTKEEYLSRINKNQ